jgi:hypothetical protein
MMPVCSDGIWRSTSRRNGHAENDQSFEHEQHEVSRARARADGAGRGELTAVTEPQFLPTPYRSLQPCLWPLSPSRVMKEAPRNPRGLNMTCLQLAITEPISPLKALYQQPARNGCLPWPSPSVAGHHHPTMRSKAASRSTSHWAERIRTAPSRAGCGCRRDKPATALAATRSQSERKGLPKFT